MSLLDLHQDDLQAAAANTLALPKPKPEPKFSIWKATTAVPRGVAAGAVQSVAMQADLAGAFGGYVPASASSVDPIGAAISEASTGAEDAQRRQAQARGLVFDSGDALRGIESRAFRPDAQTASTAERLLYDIPRVLTKAVGYVATTGGVPGAALTGLDEGMVAADDLKQAGVDIETRTKVGAVRGAATAAGVLLPVAGKTVAQTAGLVALGGPGAFMAEQSISRKILQDADYSQLANQYDPLDPVGLTLATVVPAAFGGYAMRARVKADRPVPTPEQVDAALVAESAQRIREASLAPADDLAGQQRHVDALDKASEQLARGERVEVADIVEPTISAAERASNFRAWFGDSKVVDAEGKPLVVYHGTKADIEAFEAGRIGSVTDAGKLGTGFYFSESAGWASGYAGQADNANVLPVYVSLQNPLEIITRGTGERVWDALSRISKEMGITDAPALADQGMKPNPVWADKFSKSLQESGYDGVILDYSKGQREIVAFRPEQIKSAIGNSGRFDPNSASLTDPLQRIAQVFDRRQNIEQRKRVDQMTPEEMRQALLTSELTGLANRRAFNEAAQLPGNEVKASLDVDSLKWVNDNVGHEAGDKLLREVGKAMAEEGVPGAAHLSGDEFAAQGASQKAIEKVLTKVQERLARTEMTLIKDDGSRVVLPGIGLTFGLGNTLKAADTVMLANKAAREQAGLRAARGEAPKGVRELPSAQDVVDMQGLAQSAYWMQEGGRLLRANAEDNAAEVTGRTQWIAAAQWFQDMRQALGAKGLSKQDEIIAAVQKYANGEKLTANEKRTVDYMRREVEDIRIESTKYDQLNAQRLAEEMMLEGLKPADAADAALVRRAAAINQDAVERAAIRYENDDAGFLRAMQEIVGNERPSPATQDPSAAPSGRGQAGERLQSSGDAARPNDSASGADRGAGAERQAGVGAGATQDPVAQAQAARLVEIERDFPGLKVQLDGMDAPVPMRELLDMVRAQADEEIADAPLMRLAAECFLTNGEG